MMYSYEGSVHANGSEKLLRAEFSQLARGLAEEFGKDKILESALFGIYASSHEEVEWLHKKLKEKGMEV